MKLALVGRPHPEGLRGANLSAQVFCELLREQLEQRPGIDLVLTRTDEPPIEADAVLVHDYSEIAEPYLHRVKDRFPQAITASFMEVPYNCDVAFVFMPELRELERSQVILFPYDAKRLAHTTKLPGSILLDHAWPGVDTSMISKVATTFALDVVVAQLGREAVEPIDGPFGVLQHRPYLEYLRETDEFEYFVVTHSGSYNGTIVDMVARGTKVVAPEGTVTQSQQELLGVRTFTSANELQSLLTADWPVEPALTPMDQAVDVVLSCL